MLSIDVALGACAMSYALAGVMGAAVPALCYLLLFLSIWLIYTCDHLIDAHKIQGSAHTSRHLFHQIHFKPLLLVFLLVFFIAAAITLFLIPRDIMVNGSILLLASIAYLFLIWLYGSVKSWLIQKELLVALLYTLGVFLSPFTFYEKGISPAFIVLFLQAFLIACNNLLLFARFDQASDALDGHTSFIRMLGNKKSNLLIAATILLFAILTLASYFFSSMNVSQRRFQIILSCMMLLLTWIFYHSQYKHHFHHYREIADSIFFLPLLLTLQ